MRLGAHYDQWKLPSEYTWQQVVDWYRDECAQAQLESGALYSGAINMTNGIMRKAWDHVFPNPRAAETWLVDHAEKWGKAVAVRALLPVQERLNASKAYMKKKEAHIALRERAKAVRKEENARTAEKITGKDFHTCPTCKSRIATSYISPVWAGDISCPVCRNSLLTQTSGARIAKAEARAAAAGVDREEFASNPKFCEEVWLVGAWLAE